MAQYTEKDIVDAVMHWWTCGHCIGQEALDARAKLSEIESRIGLQMPSEILDSEGALFFLVDAAKMLPNAVWKPVGEVA